MRRLALFALLLTAASAAAQDVTPPADREPAWVTLGSGVGAPYGGAFVGTATFGRTVVYQIGLQATTDLYSGIWGPQESTAAFHVGAGVSRRAGPGRFTATAGPALVWGRHDLAETNEQIYWTGGVVVNGQALVAVIPQIGLGVGVTGFVNLNPVDSATGVAASLVFGGFR